MSQAQAHAARNSRAAISKRFDLFEPQGEHAMRPLPQVSEGRILELFRAWNSIGRIQVYDTEDMYYQALAGAGRLDCTRAEVEGFSLALGRLSGEDTFEIKAGLFISALMNSSHDDNFVIHTTHLEPVAYLGCYNTKHLVVKGDVGAHAGMDMKYGGIHIEGNAGENLGTGMKGGIIKLEGSASKDAGFNMKGGTLVILGDAFGETGFMMEGGIIRVNGSFRVSGICDGEIFHGDTLAYSKRGRQE